MAAKSIRLLSGIALSLTPIASARPQDTRLDHLGTTARRISTVCAWSAPGDAVSLTTWETRLADSVKITPNVPGVWRDLGCTRALLYASDPTTSNRGRQRASPWGLRTVVALAEALRQKPDDRVAAEALADIALELGSGIGVSVMLDQRHIMIESMYGAVRSGITAPAVLRACVEFAIDVGDLATSHYCIDRALTVGSDSTWHLIRLSWLSFIRNDSTTSAALFDGALAAANDAASLGEIAWRLRWMVDSSWSGPGKLESVLAPMSANARVEWLHQHVTSQVLGQAESQLQFVGSMLAQCPFQLRRNGAIAALGASPCYTPETLSLTPIEVAAHSYQFWNPTTAAPVGLLTYALKRDDLEIDQVNSDRVIPIRLELREWGSVQSRWTDTVEELQLAVPPQPAVKSRITGLMLVPPLKGITTWTFLVSQPGRFGRLTVNGGAGLDSDAVALSDLVAGDESQGLSRQLGAERVVFAPLNTVSHGEPLHLFYQLRSDARRPDLRTVIVIRRIVNGRISPTPAVSISFETTAVQGLNAVQRVLDVSRIPNGDCQLEVRVLGPIGEVLAVRAVNLYLR